MSVEIRPAGADEMLAGLTPIWHYFGSHPTPEIAGERMLSVLPEGRLHVAYDGGVPVGSAGAFAFDMTIPGGPHPVAGTTVVGVLPTHRRRGILRRLMRAQLDMLHEQGEPLAALWASEGGIYGRFGYGLASLCGDINLPRTYTAFARPLEPVGEVRLAPAADALPSLRDVYDRAAPGIPGMIARTELWWTKRNLDDSELRREGAGELNAAVLEVDGRPEAYALYRLKLTFGETGSTGVATVVEALGTTPAATAAIWRFLLDIDWMARVEAELLPVDHPLFLLLTAPTRMRYRVGDGLWVRPVDVGAALAARSYAGEGELVFEVSDPFCPWNEGRFALDGSQTGADPDLRLSADVLGSAYLGGFSFSDLARAGRVEEARPGALARADALFAVDRKPWCPEIF